jgi:hypothetical protein
MEEEEISINETFPWEESTYYRVRVKLYPNNITHEAIFFTGFLNGKNSSPGGYSSLWCANYDSEHPYERNNTKIKIFSAIKLFTEDQMEEV